MRTILFSFLISDIVSVIVIVYLFAQNKNRFKGTGFWIINFCLQTFSLVFITLRGIIPDWISIVVANVFVISGTLFGLIGLQRFLDIKVRNIHNYIVLAGFTVFHYWAGIIHPDLDLRDLNISIAMLIICSQCSILVWYRSPSHLKKTTFGVGLVFALYCVVNVIRILVFFISENQTNNYLESGNFEKVVIYSYQALLILLTFSLVLMYNRRLQSILESEETELKESTRKLYTLNNNLNGVVYRRSNDQDWTLQYISEGVYNLTGYPSENFTGDSKLLYSSLIHKEDLKEIRNKVQSAVEAKNPYTLEYRINTASGRLRWVWERGRAVFNENQLVALEGFISDITEKKLAEDEVKRLNIELEGRVFQRTLELEEKTAELEAFSYSVSHDLRAPLRALSGYTSILGEKYASSMDEEGLNLMNSITYNIRKMDNLIVALLTFSKIGKQDIRFSSVNMVTMVQSIVSELTSETKNRYNIIINNLPVCHADAPMIYQIWVNLIHNAIKYSSKKENPCIEIGSLSSESYNVYYIKDNGVGFDSKYIDRLFAVFQRLHSEKDFEGTGVGLAIVRRAVNRMGGKVWAESKLDEGASFYFSIPT